jgi:hypothetical protein
MSGIFSTQSREWVIEEPCLFPASAPPMSPTWLAATCTLCRWLSEIHHLLLEFNKVRQMQKMAACIFCKIIKGT